MEDVRNVATSCSASTSSGPSARISTTASSVSGFYFAHPATRYFGVGNLGRDQIEDYAQRKSMSVEEIERWLAPNLAYEPSSDS